jgi:ApbE superfamily uncharacterized protein (UPF0280 family)
MDRKIYRDWVKSDDLVKTMVSHRETDLCIMGDRDLTKEAIESIYIYRKEIKDYIKIDSIFRNSLEPIEARKGATPIVKSMIEAGKAAGVGPMAAIAGAVAEYVGRDLLSFSKEVIVENGGDIFIKSSKNRSFGIFAGESPLTGKLKFEIMAEDTPLGVCTSSGSVGHSLSYGKADAVGVISKDTALADAVATAAGNIVKSSSDIEKGISFARSVRGVIGVIIIVEKKFGTWGNIRLGE